MSKPIKEQVPSNMEDWDNMPIIRTLINGKEDLFGFDTGNTESILGDRIYNIYAPISIKYIVLCLLILDYTNNTHNSTLCKP